MKGNRVFYCERDFYSTPQILLIVAQDESEAYRILNEQQTKDHYGGIKLRLQELNLDRVGISVLEPPGNRDYR